MAGYGTARSTAIHRLRQTNPISLTQSKLLVGGRGNGDKSYDTVGLIQLEVKNTPGKLIGRNCLSQ
ncbi:hypothetical protein ACTXT7_003820 [Hymenolepis weldensis]